MAYTPPVGSAISLDLHNAPPGGSGGALSLEMIPTEFSGQLNYIGPASAGLLQTYQISQASFSPIATTGLVIAAPAPASLVYIASQVGVAGLLVAVAAVGQAQAHGIGAAGLVIAAGPVAYFLGRSSAVDAIPPLLIAAGTVYSAQAHNPPSGAIVLTAPAPTPTASSALSSAGNLVLGATAPTYLIRAYRSIEVPVLLGETDALDSVGGIVLSSPPAGHKVRLYEPVESRYSIRTLVRASVLSPYTARVAKDVSSWYSLRRSVSVAVESSSNISDFDRVATAVESLYTSRISAYVESSYSIREAARVFSSISAVYSAPETQRVLSSISSSYSYVAIVRSAIESKYRLSSSVLSSFSIEYDLLAFTPVATSIKSIYSTHGNSAVVNITDQPYVSIGGVRVDIIEGDVSASEGAYAWECNLTLRGVEEYARFTRDTAFTVHLMGETYEFIVDGKELSRGGVAEVTARVMGISPSARLASPRHMLADYLWEDEVLVSSIVNEVTTGAMAWTQVDWLLPAYRVAFERVAPIDVVVAFAEAAGCSIESSKAGVLRVRHLFPVSVLNYDTTAPSHIFLESVDILSVSENYAYSPVFNKYRIVDVDSEAKDTIEWIQNETNRLYGDVRAFPYPWRTGVNLTHSSDVSVVIGAGSYVEFSTEEFVEVFEGEGSTAYPIYAIDTLEWFSTDLGGIVHATDDKVFQTTSLLHKNSVAKIKYRTRCLTYPVATVTGNPTQFLLESL